MQNSHLSRMRKMTNLALIFFLYHTFPSNIYTQAISIDQIVPIEQSIQRTDSPKTSIASTVRVNDPRRPIWNLAHMVNSIKELDYRLEKGANAVEVDVTFSNDGIPLFTYHGSPCDCWRHCHQQEDFQEYLRYVREIAIENSEGIGKNLNLLFLDLKLDYLDHKGKITAGSELAKAIVDNLFTSTASKVTNELNSTELSLEKKTMNLILSVNHVTDIELIYNFLHYLEENNSSKLLDRIGFDVGMNDDIQLIESMWKKFGNTLNIWQGDGYTNCFSPFYNLERLSKALVKRDLESGYPKKVYHWTIDLHDRMSESLLMGVDAIMTNHPERLLSVLKEPGIAHNFRLATDQDNPFKKISGRFNLRNGESARYQRSAQPINGGIFGSLYDVITSWFAYIREIPFLSLPTTSRFMPKIKRHKQANVSLTKSNNQAPELRVDQSSITNQTLTSLAPSVVKEGAELSKGRDQQQAYEGPKWYTSIASNILVSLLKVILPAYQ